MLGYWMVGTMAKTMVVLLALTKADNLVQKKVGNLESQLAVSKVGY